MKSSFPALSTPVTCAPRRLASWIANDPDPPPPPFTSTRRPGAAPTVPWSAIAPAWGMVDASANVSSTGLWASAESAATAYSAKPPLSERLSPYTSSPGTNRVTPSPTASTRPAMSEPRTGSAGARTPPMREYSGEPRRVSQSLRLTDVAATWTSTWPAAGDGTGTSSTRRTSGDPYRSWTTALICVSPPRRSCTDLPVPTYPRRRVTVSVRRAGGGDRRVGGVAAVSPGTGRRGTNPRSAMAQSMTTDGLARLDEVMSAHVERGAVPGMAWLVARRGEVHTGAAGTDGPGGTAVGPDTIFRISSMTKPITTVAALALLEECRLRLDDPVDELLPELADRRVLARPDAPLDDTVSGHRPVTLRDLLTFRLGLGMDFTDFSPRPITDALAALGLGAGPPAPAGPPPPDEWMRRLGTVPLMYQPGERWLYHTSAEVLGVLIARATGQTFDAFLAERVFGPLGMVDTGFSVPADKLDRFGACFGADPATGERTIYDVADGQWSTPPAFPSRRAGGGC